MFTLWLYWYLFDGMFIDGVDIVYYYKLEILLTINSMKSVHKMPAYQSFQNMHI